MAIGTLVLFSFGNFIFIEIKSLMSCWKYKLINNNNFKMKFNHNIIILYHII